MNGTPKPMGVLIMGSDLVAVDATCCHGVRSCAVAYLVMGGMKKLGHFAEPQIKQLGETIVQRSQPFATVEHFQQFRLAKPA